MINSSSHPILRSRNVTAILGPTNTGKTHMAIERMLAHESGVIGLPLRLLAREVYSKVLSRVGPEQVALITGEEKIKPAQPKYWVCTVEAMPENLDTAFLAIDEVQLAADLDRGHVFTHRLLTSRGREETLILGAGTMRDVVAALLPSANLISRPRLSKLTHSGVCKVTRLPRRSAIVAFSAEEVYTIADLVRSQKGGAAVVLGALSPTTRNAQVEMYQSGVVDYLVATDAIGMGLNLDVDHVFFAGMRKFDGFRHRDLAAAELAQIAGRAGRHLNDGSFGVTNGLNELDAEVVEAIENHHFPPVKSLQWRNPELDFSSVDGLYASLNTSPSESHLVRCLEREDVLALDILRKQERIQERAASVSAVTRLWDACQLPDYLKISPANHGEIIGKIFCFLHDFGQVPAEWFMTQLERCNKPEGDIEVLFQKIAETRTWAFVANRSGWLENAQEYQAKAQEVETRLSDALHQRLMARFVDQRTSNLIRHLRDSDRVEIEISADGGVLAEGEEIGRLSGFSFIPAKSRDVSAHKALGATARRGLSQVLAKRAANLFSADASALTLTAAGDVRWNGDVIGRVAKGRSRYEPSVILIASDSMAESDRAKLTAHLNKWIGNLVVNRLGELPKLAEGGELSGLNRGIAFQLGEKFGILDRENVKDEVRSLDQEARSVLRNFGVRFGAFSIYLPLSLKPAARELILILRRIEQDFDDEQLLQMNSIIHAGRTSLEKPDELDDDLLNLAGYRTFDKRAIRVDILERTGDLIRELLKWRAKSAEDPVPNGAHGTNFFITTEMLSLLGCGVEEMAHILKKLGYFGEKVKLAKNAFDELRWKNLCFAAKIEATSSVGRKKIRHKSITPTPPVTKPSESPHDQLDQTDEIQQDPLVANTEQEQQTTVLENLKDAAGDTMAVATLTENEHPHQALEVVNRNENVGNLNEPEQLPQEIELTLWRLKTISKVGAKQASTRNSGASKKHPQSNFQNNYHSKGKSGGHHNKKDARRGRADKPQSSQPNNNFRRHTEKKADPLSPFAILANLKSEMTSTKGAEKGKKGEKNG